MARQTPSLITGGIKKEATAKNQSGRALICCRVSSDRQIRDGHGIESQEQRCRQYAEQKGYVVEKIFYDRAISGALFDRPAVQEILKYLDKNFSINYIIIFDYIDRIARDVQVHWRIKKEFGARGAKVESPNFKFEDTPEGRFIETVLAGKAQLDREQNARQVKQKMKARLELGYWCFSKPPYGYEILKTKEHGKLLFPKEPEAEIVKKALEGFANDRFLNKVDLLNYLAENKTRIRKRVIDFDFVSKLLLPINLTLYSGYVEYPKWEVSRRKGCHEAIISLEIVEMIRLKLQMKDKSRPNLRDRIEFPLRRLVYCAICGEKMTGSKVKGKRKYYMVYTCNNKNCTAKPKNIQTHILESEYIKLLKSTAPEREIIELTEAISLKVWNESTAILKVNQKAILDEIRERERAIEEYIKLIPKSLSELVKTKYEEKIEQLENEIMGLKKQSFRTDCLNYNDALDEVKQFLRTPAEFWEKANLEGKFMIHNLIFSENPRFDLQNGFGTPKTSLPFAIKYTFSGVDSSNVGREGFEPPKSEDGRFTVCCD